jgi:hypothetical protein
MAAKFFVGLDFDDPDPECVKGAAEPLLAALHGDTIRRSDVDHSRPGTGPTPVRFLSSPSTRRPL